MVHLRRKAEALVLRGVVGPDHLDAPFPGGKINSKGVYFGVFRLGVNGGPGLVVEAVLKGPEVEIKGRFPIGEEAKALVAGYHEKAIFPFRGSEKEPSPASLPGVGGGKVRVRLKVVGKGVEGEGLLA